MAATTPHHHHSTTKTSNKPFKSRHASKSMLKERSKGRVEQLERGTRRTPHQHVMSKLDRRNHAKQVRMHKLADRRSEKSIFEGRDGAPRIVAVIPLCDDVDTWQVIRQLNESADINASPEMSPWTVEIPRFKQRLQYLAPSRDLFECLDACRMADYVILVLSATEEVDNAGEQMLRCIESQGVPTILTGVHNLTAVEPAKKRPDVVKSLKHFITHFFATQEKVHDIGNRQECSNLLRSLCTTAPKAVGWREYRSWMVIEQIDWVDRYPMVTGVVRGKGLKCNRLVQLGEWGDFQIEKITAAPRSKKLKAASDAEMATDGNLDHELLATADQDQDDLATLAPEEAIMAETYEPSMGVTDRKAVLIDDHHYFDEEAQEHTPAPKRLPRGTSKYQAAWYLDDVSDSGSDLVSVSDDSEMEFPVDDISGISAGNAADDMMHDMTEAGAASEYPISEVFNDVAPEEESEAIAAYRQKRRHEAKDDLEFPDEIELHPNVRASERLAKYRGLKDFRTSTWDTEEDKLHEPDDWRRLLEIADYRSAKNRVIKDTLVGGITPGTRICIHLRVNPDDIENLKALPNPTAVYSLLRHEHKYTSMNCSITLSSDYSEPVRSKEQLFMQCGPRRIAINPLFSQAGNTPNDVHKFERYLHPGRTAIASFIGPMTWGNVPCLFFRRRTQIGEPVQNLVKAVNGKTEGDLELIGTGTTLPPSISRVVAKRVVLTGHPYKIHKKLVTVRYMFFNAEDVQYFKALQLWTRRGNGGYIKETLGTHGYFKATFDAKINSMDAVAMSLYKRVWPRQASTWRLEMKESHSSQKNNGLEEDVDMH